MQAMVRMKALSNRCVTEEGVVTRLHERIKNLVDGHAQYKDANCILCKEVKELKEKLEEESRWRKSEEETKLTVEKELKSILSQVETARNDVVTQFKDLQSFIEACVVYYGDGFEDCLKQVKSVYPDLDLSTITMDESTSSTLTSDTVKEECDITNNLEANQKNDSVVLAQPAVGKSITLTLLANLHANDHNAEDPPTPGVQPTPAEGDGMS